MKYLIPFLFSLQLLAATSLSVTYDSVTKTVAPSNMVLIAPLTATVPSTGNSVANKTYVDALGLNQGWVNVKNAPYNAVGNGASDDTAALQSALNSGLNVFLPSGDYKITASLTNSMYRKINGQGRSVSSISATTTNTALVFESAIPSSGDINASFELKDLAIYAKNAVAINQVGITNWDSQSAVANIRLIHCTFSGTYQTLNDPLAGTTNVPTLAFLVSEGVGIKAAKLYDSLIQNCFIFGFGIGVYLDACDINNIDTCRLNQNARHIHLTKHDGVGSQNKIKNNDILINWRVGGIYEDQTRWNTIEDNYFESNYASSQYWINYQGEGTTFQNNRIDAPVGTIPIISINAGGPGVILAGNRGGSDRTIEILHDFWNGNSAQQTLVQFADNLSTFPETLSPQSSYTKRSSSRVWGPYSPKRLLGNASTNWPWGTTSGGLPGISTVTSGNLIVQMATESTDDSLEVAITAEAAGGYVNVKWGGTSVWLADWSTSTNLQTVTRQIVRPSGVLPDSGLVFEFAASQGYICGIQLTPSPQNIQGSTLTISTNAALSGTVAVQAAAAGSAATHFPVFTATPASAATTVKMRTAAEVRSDIGAGTGSVTSVGLTAPAQFSVASSPVTTSGTIAVSYASSPTGTGVFVLSTNATLFNASLTGDPAIQASGPGVSLTYFPGWETNPSSGAVQIKSRNASNFRSDIGGGASTGSVGLVLKNNPTIDTTTLLAVTAMQAAAAGSAATHFPVYTASPAAGAVAVKSRTAAEVRSDIGAGTGSGTVTSVAASVPSFLSISGSPITTSGTLAVSYSGTALPVTNGGTGLTALGTGLGTALGLTPTGSGVIVLATNAVLTTPTIGDASATSIAVSSAVNAGSVASFTTITAGGNISGLNLSGSNTGDQTTITGNAGTATTLATGRTIGITGDLTWTSPTFNGSGNVTGLGTLGTVNGNVGTFGSATQAPTIVANGKGLVTAVTNITITPAVGSITGLGTGVATALAAASTGTLGLVRSDSPDITGSMTVDGGTLKVDGVNNRVGVNKAIPAYTLDVAGRISYSTTIGEGADITLSSSGTTLQHALSSAWIAQNFYAGGTNAIALTKSGTTILGPLSTPAGQSSFSIQVPSTGSIVTGIRHGIATLVAGEVTVSQSSVSASTRIFLTSQSDGATGTPGWLRVSGRGSASTFTISSSSNTDTSNIGWLMIEP